MPLTRVIDLIGRNTHLHEFLPPLAASLRTVANFDILGVVVPHDGWRTAQLNSVHVQSPDDASAPAEVLSMTVAPLDPACLAALVERGSPATAVSYTHLRAHETPEHLVCRLLLEKKK